MADSIVIEAVKIVVPSLLSAFGGYYFRSKEVEKQERKGKDDKWSSQIQSHWSPLLRAARNFKDRLIYLTDIYNGSSKKFNPDWLSADFRELYVFERDKAGSLQDWDANAPRKDKDAVQRMKTRVCHELTFAESTLYITVKYLGNAERVNRNLYEHILELDGPPRDDMMSLISGVREALQGDGAGIFVEQQEYIGETVWGASGGVITNLEFRNRLFDLPGWEQFANLLRCFAEFKPKVGYEVKATIEALTKLEPELARLCSCRSKGAYEALRRSLSQEIGTDGSPAGAPSGSPGHLG